MLPLKTCAGGPGLYPWKLIDWFVDLNFDLRFLDAFWVSMVQKRNCYDMMDILVDPLLEGVRELRGLLEIIRFSTSFWVLVDKTFNNFLLAFILFV